MAEKKERSAARAQTVPGRTRQQGGRPASSGGPQTPTVEVVRVDADNNLLVVRGSVPGAGGGIVVIRKS